MSAPQDVLKQVATAEGLLANAITAPLGVPPSSRPLTPLEVLSQTVSGGKLPLPGLPGTSGQLKLPQLPALPGLPGMTAMTEKGTPTAPLRVGAQATEKLATSGAYY